MELNEMISILYTETGATLYMALVSAFFAYVIGLPLGVLATVTATGGLKPVRALSIPLSFIIDMGRSIPFIILMVALMPLTKLITGKTIGPSAAIVSLVIAAAPFVARLVENSLSELEQGVILSAKAMGASNMQIILKVLLPESLPSLIRGFSVTAITLIGYSAMAGAVGGGGLGDVAIRYGYHRYQADVMWITIVVLIIIVALIQTICNFTANKLDKRKV